MADTPKVDVVGVGLNATDTVISLESFPAAGAKVEFTATEVFAGGQVATAMVACQRWGLQTRYVGRLGDDAAAALHHAAFTEYGVEAHVSPVAGCSSQQSIIVVDRAGERTVLWKRDERLSLAPQDLRREWITQARVLHLDGYDTLAATLAAGWAREAGVRVVADLDELYSGIEQLLPLIDYLIVSRDFPCRLMREPDVHRALVAMRSRYGCKLAAATLGEGGVVAWDGREFCTRAAFRVPVVDTTGAGDIFHAGFIYGLLQGWERERQLDFACAAAALNCTGLGARGGIATFAEIEKLRTTGERYGPSAPGERRVVQGS